MTHDVFISHSSKDRAIGNAICSILEQHHIRCWIAPRDILPSSDYAESIVEAIGSSRLTVLVFSSNSNESPHVRREIERSASHGIPVLPFRVEQVQPSQALEYFISNAHWLDAMTPPFEQHLDHLVGTVQILLEREAVAAGRASAGSGESLLPPAPPSSTQPPPPIPAAAPVLAAPPRRRPPTAVLAAIGAAALLVVAGGAILLGGVGRPGPSQAAVLPSASAAPTVTPAPTASSVITPTPQPSASASDATPNPAVARLTAALPAALSCEPVETPSGDSSEAASVFCYLGDGTVAYVDYTLYASLTTLRSEYASWADYYHLAMGTTGSCEKGQPVEDSWSFQSTASVAEGHYFCVVDDGGQAHLFWSDEATLILVDLGGDTGVTLDKLYPIWRGNTYDPVRP